MDYQTILQINLIVGIASFITSLTGFGYALVSTPFLLLFLPPQMVVPLVLFSSLPLSGMLVWEAYKDISLRRIGGWLSGAVVGGGIGVYSLATFPEETMKQVIGVITLVAAVSIWLKPAQPFKREGLVGSMAGCLSGILGGASGMSGPPIVLFGLNQGWDYRGFRADMIGYFAVLHTGIVILFRNVGILNGETLALGGWALPGLAIGYGVGIRIKPQVSQGHFRILTFALVSLGGVLAIVWH
jgi:uncharacterized membrane protein YfcA